MDRRIAAILVADMVGYSRLAELDEAGVVARQKRHFAELIRPKAEEWRGRIVKLTGDGLIAVFDSVVDAVQCAVHVQREMAAREGDQPADRRIVYRVAVNLGDVIFDEGDVYGDGVNVAARLEALAEPGGVIVSGAAHDMLKANVPVGYRALGEVKVKNLSQPVRAFQVIDDPALVGKVSGARGRWKGFAAAAAVIVVFVGAAGWWLQRPDFAPVDPDTMSIDLPDRPSIAILPFDPLPDESDVRTLARGLAEGLENELTSSPLLLVVAAASNRDLSGAEEARWVAAENGVRYVLAGSFQSREGRVRVTAQLIDAVRGRNVWSRQYEDALSDNSFFDILDSIVEAVAFEIDVELGSGAIEKRYTSYFDTLEKLRLQIEWNESFQRWDSTGNNAALEVSKDLLALDPENPMALTLSAWTYWQRVVIGLSQTSAEDFDEALEMSRFALEIAPTFAPARAPAVWVHLHRKQYGDAETHIAEYLKLAGGVVEVSIAEAISKLGRPDEAEKYLRDAMRRQRRFHDWVPLALADALSVQGKLDDARSIYEGLLNAETTSAVLHWQAALGLAAIHVRQGSKTAAGRYVDRARKEARWMGIRNLRDNFYFWYPDQEWVEGHLSLLAQAGMPD